MESIKKIVSENYNLSINDIKQTVGGWSAEAYIAKTEASEYFVKVYDKQRASVQPWIARMELYIPVQLWIYENTPLRDRIIAPLLTTDGKYKAESEDYILLVFKMLHGKTIGNANLDTEQIRQLAVILAELHSYTGLIPIETSAIKEDYSLPFLHELISIMEAKDKPAELYNLLSLYTDDIKKGIEILKELSVSQQGKGVHNVLCHTDIHGWNLMLTDKIVLIDWEGLRLAPAEADLFAFSDGFFFDYAKEELMSVYQGIRKDYIVSKDAISFYRLRRRMEDISEFLCSLVHDELSPEETTNAFRHLKKECASLSEML
jgi:spectinomycin phosphotransferase